ncbi:hypothetical protein H8356DRAFT_1340107 [Neocallimastix lanati (nom. inval.)]|nr:hypothetical protein H8356DRAFT_1340107 [Neocallimastix sp. JGI-2020a]
MEFISILTIVTSFLVAGSINSIDYLKSETGNFRIDVTANAIKFNNKCSISNNFIFNSSFDHGNFDYRNFDNKKFNNGRIRLFFKFR